MPDRPRGFDPRQQRDTGGQSSHSGERDTLDGHRARSAWFTEMLQDSTQGDRVRLEQLLQNPRIHGSESGAFSYHVGSEVSHTQPGALSHQSLPDMTGWNMNTAASDTNPPSEIQSFNEGQQGGATHVEFVPRNASWYQFRDGQSQQESTNLQHSINIWQQGPPFDPQNVEAHSQRTGATADLKRSLDQIGISDNPDIKKQKVDSEKQKPNLEVFVEKLAKLENSLENSLRKAINDLNLPSTSQQKDEKLKEYKKLYKQWEGGSNALETYTRRLCDRRDAELRIIETLREKRENLSQTQQDIMTEDILAETNPSSTQINDTTAPLREKCAELSKEIKTIEAEHPKGRDGEILEASDIEAYRKNLKATLVTIENKRKLRGYQYEIMLKKHIQSKVTIKTTTFDINDLLDYDLTELPKHPGKRINRNPTNIQGRQLTEVGTGGNNNCSALALLTAAHYNPRTRQWDSGWNAATVLQRAQLAREFLQDIPWERGRGIDGIPFMAGVDNMLEIGDEPGIYLVSYLQSRDFIDPNRSVIVYSRRSGLPSEHLIAGDINNPGINPYRIFLDYDAEHFYAVDSFPSPSHDNPSSSNQRPEEDFRNPYTHENIPTPFQGDVSHNEQGILDYHNESHFEASSDDESHSKASSDDESHFETSSDDESHSKASSDDESYFSTQEGGNIKRPPDKPQTINKPISIPNIHGYTRRLRKFRKDPDNKGKPLNDPVGDLLKQKEHLLDQDTLIRARNHVSKYESDKDVREKVNKVLRDKHTSKRDDRNKKLREAKKAKEGGNALLPEQERILETSKASREKQSKSLREAKKARKDGEALSPEQKRILEREDIRSKTLSEARKARKDGNDLSYEQKRILEKYDINNKKQSKKLSEARKARKDGEALSPEQKRILEKYDISNEKYSKKLKEAKKARKDGNDLSPEQKRMPETYDKSRLRDASNQAEGTETKILGTKVVLSDFTDTSSGEEENSSQDEDNFS